MINQKTNISTNLNRLPITPQRIAGIRIWNDLLILVVSFVVLNPILDNNTARIVLVCAAGMLTGSLIGYFLIQQGRTLIGMGFVIYGLLLGLTTISIFVEELGPFTIVTMVLVTTLSVSYAIPLRRVIEAVSASILLGAFSLFFDLNTRGGDFRLDAPPQLTTILWVITLILVIIFLYFIARQFQFFSLRAKMVTSFAVITILALSVLGFLNSRSIQKVLSQEANQSIYNAAAQTEEALRRFISSNLQSIKTEAKLPTLIDYLSSPDLERQNLSNNAMKTLNAFAEKDPAYISSYALLDLHGNVLLDTQSQPIATNESDIGAFSEALKVGAPVMSQVEIDPFTAEPSIYFSTPILINSEPSGVLRIRYRAEILQSIISQANNLGDQNSFAVLFDENFVRLAHGIAPETRFTSVAPLDPQVINKLIEDRRLTTQTAEQTFLNSPDLAENLRYAQNSPDNIEFFEATDIATDDLVNRAVALNMIEPSWLLVFFQPQEVYLAPVEILANNTILLGLLSGLGAVILGIGLTQILTRPLLNLTQTAEQVSKGDFDAKVEISTEDEIGTLGKTFNTMTLQIQNLITNLENQVETRTKSLRNQAAQLRASAEVARDVAAEQELQNLLDLATNLIYERFGYYHVGIYLKDSKNEYAVLMASTDQPGKRLLQAEQRYKIDPESNVGYACILGEALIASASDQSAQLSFHPLLASSQAQLVLPLSLADGTLGVIDIHSTNPNSFTQEDVQIFQTLADQIAIAIQKAIYRQELQETLSELETAYGTFTKESWQKFAQTRKKISGYRYDQRKVEMIENPGEEVIRAWQVGEKVIHSQEKDSSILAIPMKVRGEVIGVLNIEFASDHIPPETSDLVSEIADRLGLILENARLIETAQKQVEREQLTSHITNTIRQSLNMDVVVRTAVQEIGQRLGLSEVELRLGTSTQVENNNGKQNPGSVRT